MDGHGFRQEAPDREARRQRGQRILEDHLHAAPEPQTVGPCEACQIATLDAHAAGGRTVQADKCFCQRRLAAATFANQPDRLGDGERQADTGNGLNAAGESDEEIFDLNVPSHGHTSQHAAR